MLAVKVDCSSKVQRHQEILQDGCPKWVLVDGVELTLLRLDNIQHHALSIQMEEIPFWTDFDHSHEEAKRAIQNSICQNLSYFDPEAKEIKEDTEVPVHSVLQTVPIASQRLAQIHLETTKDEVLNSIMQIIKVGWPSNKKDLNIRLKSFWNYCQELAKLDGLVVNGKQIVIARCMRAGILDQLHASHLGAGKTNERARTSVFWLGITQDIERLVIQCKVCANFAPSQQTETIIASRIPNYLFQHVGTDLIQLNGQDYMDSVDYMS
ncbi:hypothetical protein QYM36_001053 [Artemia franciscana]|uniref:RNA-directed DNA polymerase n=1 Tax=Artemia franciscana TaxID=6661 RepID=A0AA88LHP9_ARTSF|nr:hypothetical protein QYM36_001053 [Artemia franciscana]